jgi:hypothetical protein
MMIRSLISGTIKWRTSLCGVVNSENQVRGCIFDGQICTLAYRKGVIFVRDLIVMSVANMRMINVLLT